jgi:CdiI N-terminal domain
MKFSIDFTNNEFLEDNQKFLVGKIKIGEFQEEFTSSLSYWNKTDYLEQWKSALIKTYTGSPKSCLVTSMFDPLTANFIFLWTLYLDKSVVHIQNQILFLDELDKPFLELNPYESIRDREIISDAGDKISEWDVNVNEIKEYLALLIS